MQHRIRLKIIVVRNWLRDASPIASQVGRHGVKASLRQREQLISPCVRQLREAVKEHNAWLIAACKARFENVKVYAGVGVDLTRANTCRQCRPPVANVRVLGFERSPRQDRLCQQRPRTSQDVTSIQGLSSPVSLIILGAAFSSASERSVDVGVKSQD
jgi:hypothetical protein